MTLDAIEGALKNAASRVLPTPATINATIHSALDAMPSHHSLAHHVITRQEYLSFLTVAGMIASCTVICSPLGFVRRLTRGEVPVEEVLLILPTYLMMLLQAALWCAFGYVTNNHDIYHINGFATCMTLVYLFYLCRKGIPSKVAPVERAMAETNVALTIGLLISGLAMVNTLIHDPLMKANIISNCAILFNVGLFLAPLATLVEALRTKKLDAFPLALTSCAFVSCTLWTQYSLLIGSMPYLLVNSMGVLVNGGAIFTYIYLNSVYNGSNPEKCPLIGKKGSIPVPMKAEVEAMGDDIMLL